MEELPQLMEGAGEEALMRSEASLREANGRLNLLASLTRHDALNDLAALGMYLELAGQEQGTATGVLVKMGALLHALRRKLEFTREYAGLGISAAGWEDLGAAVRQGLGQVDTGHLRIDLDLPAIEIYRDPLFGRAVANLADNTLRHGEHAACLRFGARVDPEGCTLLVGDDGAGIPAGRKEVVFRPGSVGEDGHGLFLVREILALTGMTIRETGEPGKGARFEIRIPREGCRVKAVPGDARAGDGAASMPPASPSWTGQVATE